MFEFVWPWAFACVLLFFVTRYLLKPAQQQQAALTVPNVNDFRFSSRLNGSGNTLVRWVRMLLLASAWVLLCAALARPQWTGEPVPLSAVGRDVIVAVDISGSMSNARMTLDGARVSRLTAVKQIVADFLLERGGDRVGLILFGSYPYVYAPLTYDISAVAQLLAEAPGGIAGARTSIGDTIGLAVKRLRQRPEEQRVLVLLTDGSHNSGTLTPNEAAGLAAEMGVRVHTIGVGGDSGGLFGSFNFSFSSQNPGFDAKVLQQIAKTTGGQYFSATNANDLLAVYETINELEPIEQEARFFRPIKALYYIPLGASAILFGLLWLTAAADTKRG